MVVGLADILHPEAESTVEEDERPDEHAGLIPSARLPEHQREDGEQQQSLERGLVELAWMARRAKHLDPGDDLGKAHRPRQAARRAPQFGIDEIRQATGEQPDRHHAGDIIVDPKPAELLLPAEIEDRDAGADRPAVEAHPPVPQFQDLEWVFEIEARLVEEYVAEPAAQDDPERGPEDQILGMALGHRRSGLREQLEHIPIAREDAREIGQAVPAKVERPDRQRHGIEPEPGKVDRRKHFIRHCIFPRATRAS